MATATKNATVLNAHGIHCRPSAAIVRAAQELPDATFLIKAPHGDTDLRSVIGLIGLGIECGSPVTITVEADNADQISDQFVTLFETHFDFPPREEGATTQETL